MTETKTIPQTAADRYLESLTAFIGTIRNAVATGNSSQSALWRHKALPPLETQLAAAREAMAHHAIGNQQPLIDQALQSRFLARDMDGYPLNFAGEELAVQLTEKQRLVVYAAWQVCQSAGAV
jgi:hypothetical protein